MTDTMPMTDERLQALRDQAVTEYRDGLPDLFEAVAEIDRLRETAGSKQRTRPYYLTTTQFYALNQACRPLWDAFGSIYLVGSCLHRPNFRDVDVRCILADEEFDRIFPGEADNWRCHPRFALLSAAVSEWLSSRTWLPIDFQFQKRSAANAEYQGERNPIGFDLLKPKTDEVPR